VADVFGIPNVSLTDQIYWASVPDAVRNTMLPLRGSPGASAAGKALAMQGYIIDVPIMVFGWSAPLVMAIRVADGYTYVASGLMAYMPPPGKDLPGAIKVSVDAADYPPADPPPPPPDTTTMVASLLWTDPGGTSHFAPGPGAYNAGGIAVSNGQKFTQAGVVYTAVVTVGPLGLTVVYFTAASLPSAS